MEKINVPKSVQKHLSEGEEVIGKHSSSKGDYYATNKRLLRFTSASRYEALEYPTLFIKKVERHGVIAASLARIVLVLIGLFCVGLGCLIFAGVEGFTVDGSAMYNFGVALLFWVVGLGCAASGLFMRTSYYQIQSPAIAEKDRKQWQIVARWRWSGSADKLVEVLRQKSASS